MRGIILAGGTGSRLYPLTRVVNKHLLPVYDKPMIYYPINTLKELGCNEIIIISGGENIGGFADLLKDGSEFGVKLTYRVQKEAGGIPEALLCAESLVDELFPVILGDNYFKETPTMPTVPTLFTNKVPDPERFGVYHEGNIIEKPINPISNLAVTGLYIYDDSVFDFIRTLKPSERGELEVTDINNWYLQKGIEVIEYKNTWRDMGTFNTLMEVGNYVKGGLL